jgi:hypothetical protein
LEPISEDAELQVDVVEPNLGLVVLESTDGVNPEEGDHALLYEHLCQRVSFELPEGRFWCRMLDKATSLSVALESCGSTSAKISSFDAFLSCGGESCGLVSPPRWRRWSLQASWQR